MKIVEKLIGVLAPDILAAAKATEDRKAARLAAHAVTQEAGAKAFLAYHQESAWAKAKLADGVVFTPESVAYLEREVENRKIADEIHTANIKDIVDEQTRVAADRIAGRSVGAGDSASPGPVNAAGGDAGSGAPAADDSQWRPGEVHHTAHGLHDKEPIVRNTGPVAGDGPGSWRP